VRAKLVRLHQDVETDEYAELYPDYAETFSGVLGDASDDDEDQQALENMSVKKRAREEERRARLKKQEESMQADKQHRKEDAEFHAVQQLLQKRDPSLRIV
jgi:hypothetical protein